MDRSNGVVFRSRARLPSSVRGRGAASDGASGNTRRFGGGSIDLRTHVPNDVGFVSQDRRQAIGVRAVQGVGDAEEIGRRSTPRRFSRGRRTRVRSHASKNEIVQDSEIELDRNEHGEMGNDLVRDHVESFAADGNEIGACFFRRSASFAVRSFGGHQGCDRIGNVLDA